MINTFTLAPFQDHAHQYFPSHLEVDFFNIYLVIFWTALPHVTLDKPVSLSEPVSVPVQ